MTMVDGTRAWLSVPGCRCSAGGILSCQQGKRGACGVGFLMLPGEDRKSSSLFQDCDLRAKPTGSRKPRHPTFFSPSFHFSQVSTQENLAAAKEQDLEGAPARDGKVEGALSVKMLSVSTVEEGANPGGARSIRSRGSLILTRPRLSRAEDSRASRCLARLDRTNGSCPSWPRCRSERARPVAVTILGHHRVIGARWGGGPGLAWAERVGAAGGPPGITEKAGILRCTSKPCSQP